MLLCFGGVCVPYTAVVPIIILALKWVAVRLAQMGLLPKAAMKWLQVSDDSCSEANSGDGIPCITSRGPSKVHSINSDKEFEAFCGSNESKKIVIKFTASWCKPCHRVQPAFEKLSSHYEEAFLSVDVDDCAEVASKYDVKMMPTFLIVKGDEVVGTYSGSNENELSHFLKQHIGRSA